MIDLGEPEQQRVLAANPEVTPYDPSVVAQTASYGTGHAKVRKGHYSANPSSRAPAAMKLRTQREKEGCLQKKQSGVSSVAVLVV
jgi:hypothetical protein